MRKHSKIMTESCEKYSTAVGRRASSLTQKRYMQFRQKRVSYMGHIISSEGLRADPNKLKAINEMPPPTDKEGVQRVLGMISYVQKFATNLADLAKPLRELVKKDHEFVWDKEVHGRCLDQVKQILTQAPVLKFFGHQKKTVPHV